MRSILFSSVCTCSLFRLIKFHVKNIYSLRIGRPREILIKNDYKTIYKNVAYTNLLCPNMESKQHSLNNLAPLCIVLLELLTISQIIYMQSNKIHNVVLMSKFQSALKFSSTCFGPHRFIIRSVLYKLYLQTEVCAVIQSRLCMSDWSSL